MLLNILLSFYFFFSIRSGGVIIYEYYTEYDARCKTESIQRYTYYPTDVCNTQTNPQDTSFECENFDIGTSQIFIPDECLGGSQKYDIVSKRPLPGREVFFTYFYSDNGCDNLLYVEAEYDSCSTGDNVETCARTGSIYYNSHCRNAVCNPGGKCCDETVEDSQMKDLKIVDVVVSGGSEMLLFLIGVVMIIILVFIIVVGICGLKEMKNNM